jgi:uncharacterized protein YndB with AHSA1/START domain
MNAGLESEPGPGTSRTTVERKSDREVVVTRTINGRARLVFEAFTRAELLERWWVPRSMGMTNEEGGEGGPVTTVTFEEKGGRTLVVLQESYPSKEALDAAGTGAADAMIETFDQLDELLVARGESSGQ